MVMNVLKLKDGVFGFTWNFETGEVEEVFTEKPSSKEIQLICRVMEDHVSLILEDHDIELVFGDDYIADQDELVEMCLDGVMEFKGAN